MTLSDCADNPRKVLSAKVRTCTTVEDEVYHSDSEMCPQSPTAVEQSPAKIGGEGGNAASGIRYPPDVWFLIARYVRNEDLLRFALICRDTRNVLLSMHFWKQLYERYHRKI